MKLEPRDWGCGLALSILLSAWGFLSTFFSLPEPKEKSGIYNKCGCRRVQGNRETDPSPTVMVENQVRTERITNPGNDCGEELPSCRNLKSNSSSLMVSLIFISFVISILFGINYKKVKRHTVGESKMYFHKRDTRMLPFSLGHCPCLVSFRIVSIYR